MPTLFRIISSKFIHAWDNLLFVLNVSLCSVLLQLVLELPIYGRISVIELFRPKVG